MDDDSDESDDSDQDGQDEDLIDEDEDLIDEDDQSEEVELKKAVDEEPEDFLAKMSSEEFEKTRLERFG